MDALLIARILQVVFSALSILELIKLGGFFPAYRWYVLALVAFVTHIMLFAISYIIMDDSIMSIEEMIYVQWSVFIRLQAVMTIGLIAFMLNRDVKRLGGQ